ncbi:hypothetical protein G6F64_014992 [Rhizopus arrhizus]|uniref:Uncharacterized protein n=1 Tax=Rhizopus oryzae TaxID=64495 RepID=A0A9P6WSD4_RHIOR|nr:hypothetical protein G6F64_014992 [Rhizopus arrhizus]
MRRKPVKRASSGSGEDESGVGWPEPRGPATAAEPEQRRGGGNGSHSTWPGLPELPNGQLGCGSQPGA